MKRLSYSLSALLITLLPTIANAYVGPGAGLSAIGSLLALLLAIVVAFVGFFWYPIKRLIARTKNSGVIIEEDTIEVEADVNSAAVKPVAMKENSD